MKTVFSKSIYFLIFVLAAVCFWFFYLQNSYYVDIPVKFGRYDFPIIDVNIENHKYPMVVDVGCRFPLFLTPDTLERLNKVPKGSDTVNHSDGRRYETPAYLIPKVKISDLMLENVISNQSYESEPALGKIGKFLGRDYNLFLDFPSSRIIACNSFFKLKQHGISIENWIKVPFESGRLGVILKAETDLGPLNLCLNTCSTFSFVRSNLVTNEVVQHKNDYPYFRSSIFNIGNDEYNGVDLYCLDISSELREIDGFLGVEFLKKHAIYIDNEKKFLYIQPSRKYFENIPISLSTCQTPIIPMHVNDKIYSIEIDLGCSFHTLNQDILNNLQKERIGTKEWLDIKGNEYESACYKIPELMIGSMILSDVTVREQSAEFITNSVLLGNPCKTDGSIGLAILEKYNILFDIKNNCIYTCSSFSELKKRAFFSENFIKIPFLMKGKAILLKFETDFKTLSMILDTGCTLTLLKEAIIPKQNITKEENAPFPLFESSIFKLGEHDFGKRIMPLISMSNEADYDGLLGMDFLSQHAFYIDYPNQLIYIDLEN